MEKLSKRDVLALAVSSGDASNSELSEMNLSGVELIRIPGRTCSMPQGRQRRCQNFGPGTGG